MAGYLQGVDYFRNSRVVTLSSREGLTADGVMSVVAARDGTVWLGNREGLDFVRGGRLGSIRQQDGLSGHRVTSLYEDHADRLWVGTDRLLTVYDRGHFQRVNMPDGRSPGIVTAITEDIEQNIWVYVADRERLLLRIHDLRVLDQFTASQIPPARVLAQDPQGGIWLGLFNGNLAHYRGARLEVIPLTHSSVDSPVMSIFVDGDNSVWAATRNSLFRWKEGRLQQLTARQGLPCDGILAIAEDSQKTLWLYANCGAFAIADSELERWWKMPDTTGAAPIRSRRARRGAAISDKLSASGSKSRDGRLWFANDTTAQIIESRAAGKKLARPTGPHRDADG